MRKLVKKTVRYIHFDLVTLLEHKNNLQYDYDSPSLSKFSYIHFDFSYFIRK